MLPHEKIRPAPLDEQEVLEGNEAMMSQQSRRELARTVAPLYRQAGKAERRQILDEFVMNTGYQRKYAISLLNHPERVVASPRKKGLSSKERGKTQRYITSKNRQSAKRLAV
jgi:hypothetical protein